MWKTILFVSVMSLALLAGCNTNNDKLNEETPMQDVENGVNDAMRDTRDAIDDTMDTVDPNINNNGNLENKPGGVDEGTINNGTLVPEVDNGTMAPGAPSVNQDDIIENSKDKKAE
ncbi:hypothetical protein CSE16_02540 [Solibacillus sp. R5-41]|uniref:hypothetical protein n=1 Tax=Solibacillus sp. R5-41 TaxID=2048654 RepID=UPI000C1293FD|nr:hypothetical protein [Solibacillus sp. R5-41]ATP38989.1 hypothetical protein CSE16_02540 [Solibacillus sp. R5-41]